MADRDKGSSLFQLTAAAGAVICGCALLALSGAPPRMPVMNLAALAIGVTTLMCFRAMLDRLKEASGGAALLAAALLVPATALLGAGTDGVSRWLVVGGITIQPALIVIPAIALAFATTPSLTRAGAVAIAACGVALQPDPAAAAMLLAGVSAALLAGSRQRLTLLVAAWCVAAFAVAAVRTVPLPPVPFVEGVLAAALSSGALATLVAALGLALLFTPALSAVAPQRSRACFAAVWATAVAASLVGPYPTPVLGFGGSAILGYLLGVGFLTTRFSSLPADKRPAEAADDGEPGTGLRFA